MTLEIKKEKLRIIIVRGKGEVSDREPHLLTQPQKIELAELLTHIVNPQEPTYTQACNALVPVMEKMHETLLDAVTSTYRFLTENQSHVFIYTVSTSLGDVRLWVSTTPIEEDESTLESGGYVRYNGRYGAISVKSTVTDISQTSEFLIESHLYTDEDLAKVIEV